LGFVGSTNVRIPTMIERVPICSLVKVWGAVKRAIGTCDEFLDDRGGQDAQKSPAYQYLATPLPA
jgi:hypothetical protein